MQKKWLAIMLIILIPALLFLYFKLRPKAALELIVPDIRKINKLNVRLIGDSVLAGIDLKLRNNGFMKINMQRLEADVWLDTMPLIRFDRDLNLVLAPDEIKDLQVPVHFSFVNIRKLIKTKAQTDSLRINFKIKVQYDTWLGEATLPYSHALWMDVPVPPEVEIEGTKLRGIRQGRLLVDVLLRVKNKGKLNVRLSETRYTIRIEDLAVATEQTPGEIILLPHSDSVYILPARVSLTKPIALLMARVSGREFAYKARLTAVVYHDSLKGSKIPVQVDRSGIIEK